MKYFLIAGEDSGDLHGSRLITEIKRLDPNAELYGMGGERMERAGLTLWKHFRELAVMGISDVLKNLGTLRRTLSDCSHQIEVFNPDRIVLIDSGGFNLRIARMAKAKNRRIDYYILPKVWAWNEGRVKKIRRYTDRAYVIFPFEEAYFRKHQVAAEYVGNPVKEQIESFLQANPVLERINGQIALLPGSRKGEIRKILPVMLETAAAMSTTATFILALNANASELIVDMELPGNVKVEYDNTYGVLRSSELALVTSGTANLETALLGTPQIVCYRTSSLNYFLGRRFIKVPFLSPVNLILGREVAPERIQNECNRDQLLADIGMMRDTGSAMQLRSIEELHVILGEYSASKRVAVQVLKPLE